MTTSDSPLSTLKAQADMIAAVIKSAERGEPIDVKFAEKIKHARATKAALKVGILMDDKLIKIDLPWVTIQETSEAGLSEYVVQQMQHRSDLEKN